MASTEEKRALESDLQCLETKLALASNLLIGLAGERTRWHGAKQELEAGLAALPGDVALAAAFLTYAGPFTCDYRAALLGQWHQQVRLLLGCLHNPPL